jgi:hypothetical protein
MINIHSVKKTKTKKNENYKKKTNKIKSRFKSVKKKRTVHKKNNKKNKKNISVGGDEESWRNTSPSIWLSDHQIYTADVTLQGTTNKIKCAVFNVLSKTSSGKLKINNQMFKDAQDKFNILFEKAQNAIGRDFKSFWEVIGYYVHDYITLNKDYLTALWTSSSKKFIYKGVDKKEWGSVTDGTAKTLEKHMINAMRNIQPALSEEGSGEESSSNWEYELTPPKSLIEKSSDGTPKIAINALTIVKSLLNAIWELEKNEESSEKFKKNFMKRFAEVFAGGDLGGFSIFPDNASATHDQFQGSDKISFVDEQLSNLFKSNYDIIVLPECDFGVKSNDNYEIFISYGGGENEHNNESRVVFVKKTLSPKKKETEETYNDYFDLNITINYIKYIVRCVHANSLSAPEHGELKKCIDGNLNKKKAGLKKILSIKEEKIPDIILGDFNIPPPFSSNEERWGTRLVGAKQEIIEPDKEFNDTYNEFIKQINTMYKGFVDLPDNVIPKTRSNDNFINVQAFSGKIYIKRKYHTDFVLSKENNIVDNFKLYPDMETLRIPDIIIPYVNLNSSG